MKYLGKITDDKDLTTKEYVDDKADAISEKIPSSASSTNQLTTSSQVDAKISAAITSAIGASY